MDGTLNQNNPPNKSSIAHSSSEKIAKRNDNILSC